MTATLSEAVLFDWDGTLIDSGDILLQCWHRVTTRVLGAPFPVTEDDRRKFLSMRGSDSFPLLTDDAKIIRELDEGFTAEYFELAAANIRRQDGSRELLAALRAQGVHLAVVTSKTRLRMNRDMEICGFVDAFDLVITGDDVSRGKPDPEGVAAALSALSVDAGAATMVGDGPVDIRAGRAAGTRTAGITHGLHSRQELVEAGPDVLVSSLFELAAFWGVDLELFQTSG